MDPSQYHANTMNQQQGLPPKVMMQTNTMEGSEQSPPGQQYQQMLQSQYTDRESQTMNVDYATTFPESRGAQLPEALREYFAITYKYLTLALYVMLSVVLGSICMIVTSFVMALTSFFLTWILNPFIQCNRMYLFTMERSVKYHMECLVQPLFRSFGACCSGIGVKYQKVNQNSIMVV